jgi:hypothetical protein
MRCVAFSVIVNATRTTHATASFGRLPATEQSQREAKIHACARRSKVTRPTPGPKRLFVQKKTRHCKFKVALRCVRESLLPCKSNKYYIFSVCACARARGRVHAHACNLAYPACNSYPPYWLHHFSTLSRKRHDFREKSY